MRSVHQPQSPCNMSVTSIWEGSPHNLNGEPIPPCASRAGLQLSSFIVQIDPHRVPRVTFDCWKIGGIRDAVSQPTQRQPQGFWTEFGHNGGRRVCLRENQKRLTRAALLKQFSNAREFQYQIHQFLSHHCNHQMNIENEQ